MQFSSPLRSISIHTTLFLIVALSTICALGACGNKATHPALIGQELAPELPLRELLSAGNINSAYRISPDGSKLAWMTADGKQTRIAIRALSGGETTYIDAPNTSIMWAHDSRHLLYLSDNAGDENLHVWLTGTQKPDDAPQDLTPREGARATITAVSTKSPSTIFIQYNKRDPKVFDLYQLDFKTGQEKMLEQNPGFVANWLVDANDKVRARITQHGHKRSLEVRDETTAIGEATTWRIVKSWNILDTFTPLEFTNQGNQLWVQTNIEQDKIGLAKLDLTSGHIQWVYNDPEADLDVENNIVKIGPRTGQPLLAVSEPGYPNNKALHPALQKAVAHFTSSGFARIGVTSVDDAEKLATLKVFDGQGTLEYLYQMDSGEFSLLSEDAFSRMRGRLAATTPVQFASRDGLTLNGYMTRPTGVDAKKALPLVVRVHGGPWYRNIWGNTDLPQAANQVQFLANRGYAVLEVNFRGSTGYGRHFLEAALGQFGKAMQEDLVDGVNWAVAQGLADPKHVAILGTSYGGYAALMGMADRKSPFACGVAVAAPSNLATLIESFPPYWSLELAQWDRFVGTPTDEEQRARMLAVSPISVARNITKPLLLIHGQEDVRVKAEHAHKMYQLVAQGGNTVELVILKDQGHFVNGLEANLKTYRSIEKTLAGCLGGRDYGPHWQELVGGH